MKDITFKACTLTRQVILLSSILCACSSNVFASSQTDSRWQPIFSIGGGTAATSGFGASEHFAIEDPETSEYFNYAANKRRQTSRLISALLGVEWHITPTWALQTVLDYNQTDPFTANGTFVQEADITSGDTYSYQYKATTKELLVEGKLLYAIKDMLYPYLVMGIGPSFNKGYGYNTNVPKFLTFTRMYANSSNTSLSYMIGLGVDVKVAANLRVGVAYHYVNAGTVQLGSAAIDGTPVPGTLIQQNVWMNEMLGQITVII